MNFDDFYKRFQNLFESLENSQEKRVWRIANKIDPHFILDDLLNPQDFPQLVENPEFNYEDGQLSGLKSARIAVNALLNDLREEQAMSRLRKSIDNKPKFDLQGWTIQDVEASILAAQIREKYMPSSKQELALVFDLDGTLFDVSYRTLGILSEWLNANGDSFANSIIDRLSKVALENVGYGLSHLFENMGLDLRDEAVMKVFMHAERHWRKRFFDGKSLVEFDKPVLGAAEFVRQFHKVGFKIIYLSGRHNKSMRLGTEAQLKNYDFPLDERCKIELKERSEIDDLDFKGHAFQKICSQNKVIANFENEYVNLAAMAQHSSECVHVILDTQHSARPVGILSQPIFRMKRF